MTLIPSRSSNRCTPNGGQYPGGPYSGCLSHVLSNPGLYIQWSSHPFAWLTSFRNKARLHLSNGSLFVRWQRLFESDFALRNLLKIFNTIFTQVLRDQWRFDERVHPAQRWSLRNRWLVFRKQIWKRFFHAWVDVLKTMPNSTRTFSTTTVIHKNTGINKPSNAYSSQN